MPTTDTDRHRARARAVCLALGALWLGGCDGGIFGTGDGSTSDGPLPVDAATTPPAEIATDAAASGSGAPEDVVAPDAVGDQDAVDADSPATVSSSPDAPEAESVQLVNALDVDPSASEPRLRLVNASGSPVALVGGSASDDLADLPFVASGTASAYVSVPRGTDLTIGYVRTPDDASLEASSTFGTSFLASRSVTTLLVRVAAIGGVDVVALPTRIASDDPTLALVRIVPGGDVGPDGGPPPAETWTLVPDGANPGGGEVELGDVALGGRANPDYRTVPAGDYRLESSATGTPPRALSFAGGTVRTLVVLDGEGELLVVEDGG